MEYRLPFEKKLKDMAKLSAKLKQGQVVKFKCDLHDQSTVAIYNWGKQHNHRHRKVSFSLPTTDDDGNDDDDNKDIDNMNDH